MTANKPPSSRGPKKQAPAKKAVRPDDADQATSLHGAEVVDAKKTTPPKAKRWAHENALHPAGEGPQKPHEPPKKKKVDLNAEQKMQRAIEDLRLMEDALVGYINRISTSQPSDKLDSTVTQERIVFVHDITTLFSRDLSVWRDDSVMHEQEVDYYTFTTNTAYCHQQLRKHDVAHRLRDLMTEQERKWLAKRQQEIVQDTFNELAPGVWHKLSDAFKAQGIELTKCQIKEGKACVILDFIKCRIEVSVPASALSKNQPSFLTLTKYNGSQVDTNFRLPLKTQEVTALPDKIRKLVRYHL